MSRKLILPSVVALMAAAVAFAADDAKTDKTRTTEAKASSGHSHSPDHFMATCIALGNQEEIGISDFARTKAENEEVKKFAEMMVKDHHAFLEKLHKFAPEATKAGYLEFDAKTASKSEKQAAIKLTAATDDDAKANDDAKSDATRTADAKTGAHGDFNHIAVGRELAALCLSSAKEKLGEKSGAEFDKCFMGMQAGMHMGMKTKLIVFQRHASGELAAILAEGQKTTEQHLAKAEAIMKDLEGHSTTTTIEKTRDGAKKDKRVIKEKTE